MEYSEFKHLTEEQIAKLRGIFGDNGQFLEFLSKPEVVTRFRQEMVDAVMSGRKYSLSDLAHHANRLPHEVVDEVERFAYERLDQMHENSLITESQKNLYTALVRRSLPELKKLAEHHVTIGDLMRKMHAHDEDQSRKRRIRYLGGNI